MTLDNFLDQLVAEERLRSGTPVAVLAAENPDLQISPDLQFITVEYNGRLPWSAAQEEVVRHWFGRVSRAELTRRVNEVLHRELGTAQYNRTMTGVMNRAAHLGLHAYRGDAGEMNVAAAAEFAGLPRDVLFRALNQVELPSVRKGKHRYVKPGDLATWLVAYREKQLAQSEMLNALDGVELVSKQEAMALIDVSETHITRYIKAGILTAWKLPTLSLRPNDRGEWLVEKHSAEEVRAARRSGHVEALLAQSEAYRAMQQKTTRQLRVIRREKGSDYLGQPDPLTSPASQYHPGCFTVRQVASHTRQAARVVYQAIRAGLLEARAVTRGGRPRYGIEPAAAHRYARRIQSGEIEAGWATDTARQIAELGLLSMTRLAERWGKPKKSVAATVRYYKIPRLTIGRQIAFRPEDIETFEKRMKKYPTQSHRAAAEAGLWTTAEVAERWGVCPVTARARLNRRRVEGVRFGQILAWRPETIKEIKKT